MIKKLFFTAVLAVTLSSCEASEINKDAVIQTAFEKMYPDAKGVEWEYRQGFSIAEFDQNFRDVSVWFNSSAEWCMSEFDITYSSLPGAVQSAFESSEWKNWRDVDVEKIERPNTETLYIIEAEMNDSDIELRYSPSGELFESILDDDTYDDNIDLVL